MSNEGRSYPRREKTDAGEIEFRLMSQADEAAVLDFAQKLPTHDLLFLPRNINVAMRYHEFVIILGIMQPAG